MRSPGKYIYKLLSIPDDGKTNAFCETSASSLTNQCQKLDHQGETYYFVNALKSFIFHNETCRQHYGG